MEPVPCEEGRTFMREVNPSSTALIQAQEGFADTVVVSPDEEVINGDVLEMSGVPLGIDQLIVVSGGDDVIRVDGVLRKVEGINEILALRIIQGQNISSF